ncbi:MAG TPA: hypothetical protein VG367_18750 [Mucilaginibacter sp.]|jgi:hypothetical protein|nr:hypothetical protein [Mucilaginibacter sp.]
MKKGYRHIIFAWMLLICFAAGQWAVYAHQHKTFAQVTRAAHGASVNEKCQLCDAMHHSSMIKHSVPIFTTPVAVAAHIYKQGKYDFVSIALILSAGRAPPLS